MNARRLLVAGSVAPLAALAIVAVVSVGSSAAAPATSSAVVVAPPAQPAPIRGDAIPASTSPMPKPGEWDEAPVVALARNAEASQCRARLVREWLKIHCDKTLGAIRQLAGSPTGVALWLAPAPEAEGWESKDAEIIVPLRRGERRVFQLFDLQFGTYGGPGWPDAGSIVEARWLEGEKDPVVVIR